MATTGPLNRIGKKEELAQRLREDDGSLIAAFANDRASLGDLPLPFDEFFADRPTARDRARSSGDIWGTDQRGNILAIEQHPAWRQIKMNRVEQLRECNRIGKIALAAQDRQ